MCNILSNVFVYIERGSKRGNGWGREERKILVLVIPANK